MFKKSIISIILIIIFILLFYISKYYINNDNGDVIKTKVIIDTDHNTDKKIVPGL